MNQAQQRTPQRQAQPPAARHNGNVQVADDLGQNPMAAAGFDKSQPLALQMLSNPDLRQTVQWLCETYAKSPTAPAHVKNSPGTVLWALDMSLSTNLHPGFIMNNMFDANGNGRLGMMSELVVAALKSKGAIKGDIKWEEHGDWDGKVQSKFKMVQSQKGKGKYAQATYTDADEKGLGLTMIVHWQDRPEPSSYGPYWMRDLHPRFSTQWATDPRQQAKNRITRKVQKEHRPDLMNGLPIGEEAHPEYYGPDNAKVVGASSPQGNLDDFAAKHGKKEPAKPAAKKEPAKAKTEPKPGQERTQTPSVDDEPPWPSGDDDGVSQPCAPDSEPDLNVEGVSIWLNKENTDYLVEAEKAESVFERALQKATSVDQVVALQNNNQELLKFLDEDARGRMNKLMDSRARILED